VTSYASYAHYARRSSIFWTFPDLSPFFMIDPIWLTNLRSVTWAEHVWTNPIPFGTSPISPVNMCMTWGIHHFWTNQKYGYMHNYTQRYKLLINCVSTHIYIYVYVQTGRALLTCRWRQIRIMCHYVGYPIISPVVLMLVPWGPCVVYGSLPPEVRQEQAALFNDPNSSWVFFIAWVDVMWLPSGKLT
jgi:hypothetical protein